MPKGKKKFIDKKNAVTFHLVHRSQHDPLAADEKAPQHVLVAAPEKKPKVKTNREEEHKYGIFFDDDYDYLQHLRDTAQEEIHWVQVDSGNNSNARVLKRKAKSEDGGSSDEEVYRVERPKQLTLPSSVFASEVEENVGLLNKAAPQSGLRLDLDPDVVAAMDEDFDFDDPDNELEDNFMELANADGNDDDGDEGGSIGSDFGSDDEFDEQGSMDADSESRDELGSLGGRLCVFDDEETKSRFTEYSMSSSVMKRNNQLSLLDQRFEKVFEAYDDNEIGALDCEEIEGFVPATSDLLLQCAAEFGKEKLPEGDADDDVRPNLQTPPSSDSEDDLRNFVVKGSSDDEKWDCQSVLSTYSNIYNRPKLISERNSNPGKIRISSKTGMPIGVFDSGTGKLTAKALSKLDAEQGESPGVHNTMGRAESIISTLSTLSIRPKGETPEERKERKKALKEYRRERIAERKANTMAFKEEKRRQEHISLNNKKNIPTVHIV